MKKNYKKIMMLFMGILLVMTSITGNGRAEESLDPNTGYSVLFEEEIIYKDEGDVFTLDDVKNSFEIINNETNEYYDGEVELTVKNEDLLENMELELGEYEFYFDIKLVDEDYLIKEQKLVLSLNEIIEDEDLDLDLEEVYNLEEEEEFETLEEEEEFEISDEENQEETNIFLEQKPSILSSNDKLYAVDYYDDAGVIESIEITSTMTGTAPFDNEEGPGNDTSENDEIVRSFDIVNYNVDLNLAINNGIYGPGGLENTLSLKSGRIYVKGELPENRKDDVEWDLKTMIWLRDGKVSNDGLTVTGYYQLNERDVTIPGTQTLVFTAKALNAKDGTKFAADITTWMQGNESDPSHVSKEAKQFTTDEVTIRSNPSLNLVLSAGAHLLDMQRPLQLDENTEVNGLLYGLGLIIQNYNHAGADKGLKGLELPVGDLEYKINLKVFKTENNVTTDVTNLITPQIYNFGPNNSGIWEFPNRPTNFGANTNYTTSAPRGQNSNSWNSVRNSGKMTVTEHGDGSFNTLVKDYIYHNYFDYPTNRAGASELSKPTYGPHQRAFISHFYQVFVDMDKLTVDDTRIAYQLTGEVELVNATLRDGRKVNDELITNDNHIIRRMDVFPRGSFSKHTYFLHENRSGTHSHYSMGDGVTSINSPIWIQANMTSNVRNTFDRQPRSMNLLSKFDDTAFEPEPDAKGRWFVEHHSARITAKSQEWKMLFGAKPDGTGWVDDLELSRTKEYDLVYYETLEELKADGKINVAVLFESQSGEMTDPGSYEGVQYRLKQKDTAKIGYVYPTVNDVKGWNIKLDRNVYTSLNGPNAFDGVLSNRTLNIEDRTYRKTEYNDRGAIVPGSHTGLEYGNSLILVGANVSITKSLAMKQGNTEKINYDIGAGEGTIYWKLSPKIKVDANVSSSVKHQITVEDTLPPGVAYIPGTASFNGTFNQETHKVDNGENVEPNVEIVTVDGKEVYRLTWYLGEFTSDDKLPEIYFGSSIDPTLKHQTQLLNTAVIHSPSDLSAIDRRTSEKAAVVVNLSAHSIYKQVDKPILEIGEEFKYKMNYMNISKVHVNDGILLDVLPYNNDTRGSNFSGTYSIGSLIVNPYTNTLGDFYVTKSTSVRGKSAGEINLSDPIWTKLTPEADGLTYNIWDDITAIVYTGSFKPEERLDFEFDFIVDGNKANDVYGNDATLKIEDRVNDIIMMPVTNRVVQRSITGRTWEDFNKDGMQNFNELGLEGVKVELLNTDYTQAKDVYGYEVEPVYTDENGNYRFTELSSGNFIIKLSGTKNLDLTDFEVAEGNNENNSNAKNAGVMEIITDINLPLAKDLFVGEYTLRNRDAGYHKFINLELNKTWVNGPNKVKEAEIIVHGDDGTTHTAIVESDPLNPFKSKIKLEGLRAYKNLTEKVVYTLEEKTGFDNYTLNEVSVDGSEGELTYDVENVFVADAMLLTIEKTWVGGDSNDRPPFGIQVYRNGEEYGPVRMVSEDVFFLQVDVVDQNGEPYIYTIDEVIVPPNYTKEVNGMKITNTYISPKTKVKANKIWKDGPTPRPNVELQLFRDGEAYLDPVTLVDGEETYTWTNLDETDENGKSYVYTVDELNVPKNYEKEIHETNVFNITNQYLIPKKDVTMNKVWINGPETKPNINIQLLKDGIAEGEIVTLKNGEETYTWENLDVTDMTGKEHIYTVVELDTPENYTKKEDGLTITNEYVSPKRNITIEKRWVNGELLKVPITIELYRDGVSIDQIILDKDNKWTAEFVDLDKTDKNGKDYIYTIDETVVPDNFIKTIDGFVITNTYTSPIISLNFNKIWIGGPEVKPSYTIQLYRNGEAYNEPVTLNGETTYKFTGLDKTDSTGKDYIYTVDEIVIPENYEKHVDGMTITNTYKSPKADYTVNKIWSGGPSKKPSVELQLYRNGEPYKSSVWLRNGKTEYTFTDLDTRDENGKLYIYTVDEVKVPEGYTKTTSGLTVTNTYEIPKTSVEVTKSWIGGPVDKPNVEIQLYRDGEAFGKPITIKNGETNYVWDNLDETDFNANKYTYTVDEINVPENYTKEVKGFNVTNTYVSPKTEFTVNKVWINGPEEKPTIKVQLYKDGKALGKAVKLKHGETTYTWENLDLTDKDGNKHIYTVDETDTPISYVKEVDGSTITNTYKSLTRNITVNKKWINGPQVKPTIEVQLYRDGKKHLESVILKDGVEEHTWLGLDITDSKGKEYRYTVDELTELDNYVKIVNGFEIHNTYLAPLIDVEAEKVWIGGELLREDVEIQLYQNGEAYLDSVLLPKDKSKVIWKELPKTDIFGKDYEYTVDEVNVPEFFEKEISKDGRVITNTFIGKPIDITIKKEWVGGPSQTAVEMQLYRNGEKYLEPVLLTDDMEFEFIFKDLEFYDENGKEYVYTVDEITEFENYGKSFSDDRLTVINTYTSPVQDVMVRKVWVDSPEDTPKPLIELQLTRNGEDYLEPIVLLDGEYDYVFSDLNITDENGNKYEYGVYEVVVPDNYESEVEELTVTNTYHKSEIIEPEEPEIPEIIDPDTDLDDAIVIIPDPDRDMKPSLKVPTDYILNNNYLGRIILISGLVAIVVLLKKKD